MTDTDLAEVKKLNGMRVLELMGLQGFTKVAACEEAGISVSTFDRLMSDHKEMVREFVAIQYTALHKRYGLLAGSHQAVIDAIIAKTTPEELADLEIADLVKLEKEIRALVDVTESQLGLIGGPAENEDAAEQVLKQNAVVQAPALRPGKTRVIQQERTTVIEFDQPPSPGSAEGSSPTIIDAPST